MYQSVRATAISLKPKKWDKPYNADKMEAFFVEAARDRPDLILTTEGVLEGYVVMDVIEGRAEAEAVLDIAEPLDGPYIQRFRKLATTLKTCLAFGFAERIGGDVFNAAIFIDSQGDIRGKYHKTQLAEGTHASWYFNRVGTTLRAFDTPLGRCGFFICNDRWNPTIARTLVLDGARLLLIPSYGARNKLQNQTVMVRARENGVPIGEANVGMNLIISKGEIAGYKWGVDQITTATIEVPNAPSTASARELERQYMDGQSAEMAHRHVESQKRLRGEPNRVDKVNSGELIAKES